MHSMYGLNSLYGLRALILIFVSMFLGGQRQRIALARAILKVTIYFFNVRAGHLLVFLLFLTVFVLCLFLAVLWVGL